MYIMYNKKYKGCRVYSSRKTGPKFLKSTAASVLDTYKIPRVLVVRLSDVLSYKD